MKIYYVLILYVTGVPSPKIWKKYIDYIEKKYDSKIKNINFREKTNINDVWNSRNLKIELENGKTIIKDSDNDYYLKGFHGKLFYRKSCKKCKFANPNRISDITIADCWGIEKIDKEINVHKGVSLIVVNTQKGKEVICDLQNYMELTKLDLEFAIKENEQFREPTKLHENRDKLYKNIDNYRFDKLIKKYGKEKFSIRMKRKIKSFIPKSLKKKIKKVLHK